MREWLGSSRLALFSDIQRTHDRWHPSSNLTLILFPQHAQISGQIHHPKNPPPRTTTPTNNPKQHPSSPTKKTLIIKTPRPKYLPTEYLPPKPINGFHWGFRTENRDSRTRYHEEGEIVGRTVGEESGDAGATWSEGWGDKGYVERGWRDLGREDAFDGDNWEVVGEFDWETYQGGW